MKTILITGGAGFIGTNLCAELLRLGEKVICVDNFYTGSRENIAQFLANPNFTLIEHDVCNPLDVKNIDEIYNLACPASPIHYQKDPLFTIRTSVLGAFNMLELAKKTSAKILQASTSEVYGDPIVHPQVESYWGNVNPIGPRACYDESKRCAESIFVNYLKQHQVNIKIARIFNTYGPHMHPNDGRVVSNFVVQALQHKDLTIYGDGKQTRSFCFVSDLVAGLIKLMASENTFHGPVNLGNPNEFTILELANLVSDIVGKINVVFEPLPIDDPKQRKPDIALAKAKLNWQPQIALRDGLRETIKYFSLLYSA
jgi:UDP-glucuronate decarboxylase